MLLISPIRSRLLAKKMHNDTVIYGFSQIIERGMSFFLLPILAKAISASEYAIWSQSVVISGVMTPILLLGFQTALIKYWPSWEIEDRQNSMMLTMLGGIGLVMLAVAIGLMVFDHQVANLIYGASKYSPYIHVLIGMMITEALFEFIVGILRANGLIKKISIYVVVKGGFRVSIFFILLHLIDVGFYAAFIVFISGQLLLIAAIYKKNIYWKKNINIKSSSSKDEWLGIVKFSIPLVMLGSLIAVNNFTDRFFLTNLYGLDKVAAYSAAYSLVAIVTFVYSVLGFILFPVLSRHMAEGDIRAAGQIISHTLLVYFFFLMPFIVGVVFVGPDLIRLLTTEAYTLPWYIFLFMSISIGFFGLYQISFYIILLAYGSMPSLSLMTIVAALNLILNSVLVPNLGVFGAALAGCISNGVLAITTFRLALRAVPWSFEWGSWLRVIFHVMLIFIVLWIGKFWIEFSSPFKLVGIIAFCMVSYFALDYIHNRNSITKSLMKS